MNLGNIEGGGGGRGFGKGNPESSRIHRENNKIAQMPVTEVVGILVDRAREDMQTAKRVNALESSIRPKLLSIGQSLGAEDEDGLFKICLEIAKNNLQFLPKELREDGSQAAPKMRAAYILALAREMS